MLVQEMPESLVSDPDSGQGAAVDGADGFPSLSNRF